MVRSDVQLENSPERKVSISSGKVISFKLLQKLKNIGAHTTHILWQNNLLKTMALVESVFPYGVVFRFIVYHAALAEAVLAIVGRSSFYKCCTCEVKFPHCTHKDIIFLIVFTARHFSQRSKVATVELSRDMKHIDVGQVIRIGISH